MSDPSSIFTCIVAWILEQFAGLLLSLGVGALIGWLFHKKKYLEINARQAEQNAEIRRLRDELRGQLRSQLEGQITNNVNVNVHVRDSQAGTPTAYDPADGQMFFGTKHGDLRVRFHDADTIIEDIDAWLNEHGLKGRVSPDAI